MKSLLATAVTLLASAFVHADSLTGAWTLVRVDNINPDGSRVKLYGPDPRGLFLVMADGRYAMEIYRPDRPKFASGDKAGGTPDEYRAAAVGANAHYGRYRVDEKAKTLTVKIEQATFPNWEGTTRTNPYRLEGDRLIYTVAVPTSGKGATGEVEWRRAPSLPPQRW